MNRSRRWVLLFVTLLLFTWSSRVLLAQTTSPASETGKFTLHKFEQPIGAETYVITRDGSELILKSDFAFTDRGTKVPLAATLKATDDYTPRSFIIKGNTSRMSDIDSDVELNGSNATIRQGKETRLVAAPQSFFTISGYAPVAVQMALIRYWRAHGSPAQLATLPTGEVRIQDRGAETIEIGGRGIPMERYSVRGLIWGLETLWMDSNNNLAALVSTDAEFDHFEAVREEYEPGLSKFVASAARDEMAALSELSQGLSGRRSGAIAFVGATVINTTGKPTIPKATIVIRDSKIIAVGPTNKVKIPSDARRIDVAGKYIIPGLWDMHAHYEQVEWGPIYLAAGVTTVRDVGNEFEFITAVRDAVNSGKGLGPHMLLAGVVDGDSSYAIGVARVNSPADAQTWVQRYHDAGFQQMKIYSSVKSENVKAICADAHSLGMTVTGHIPEGMNAYDGVNDGMDQINHIHYVLDLLKPADFDSKKATREEFMKMMASVDVNSDAGKQAVAFLRKHNTVIDPTMALMEFMQRPADVPADKIEPGVDHVAPELREQLVNGGLPAARAATGQKIVQEELAIIGALHRAGVRIVAGTDQTVPGYSLYREIELYNQAGFTPMEALQAATIVPARVMNADRDSGSIEAGKRADFDILDANPLENIHNIRSGRSVVANGVLYESAPLWESVGFKP
ncbi:MAG TPA: amidohydrolase family protein [Terriglobales bacterium]|nr:amidohydrolase family protein [Terriglobales bacterium]